MTIALIDADIVAFRCAASCQKTIHMADDNGEEFTIVEFEPAQTAYDRCNEMMQSILDEVGTLEYMAFLTDSEGNFRKRVDENYKANRKDKPRPIHLNALEEFLISEWDAFRTFNQEADDELGIWQTKLAEEGQESTICSIDKDLLTIQGEHYNFVKKEFLTITEEEAQFRFYCQLLKGDSTDNIGGCPGIGDKKAEKFLRPAYGNEQELFREVFEQYKKAYPNLNTDELEELITTIGRLVWIRHYPDEMWSIPKLGEL